jgi:uncharacterized protein YbcV (DUF1398 family)
MNQQQTDLLHQYVTEAFAGTRHFLETVQPLISIGVRWYSSDLLQGTRTHYFDDGGIHEEKWPEWTPRPGHRPFNREEVVATIRAIERREILYPEFLQRIRDGGVVAYTCHLQGKKAIYFSADGDCHIENFPKPA